MKAPSFYITTPHSLLIQWDTAISENTEKAILRTVESLYSNFAEVIVEVVPSYTELAIYLKPSILAVDFISHVKEVVLKSKVKGNAVLRHIVTIPVCYHESLAPDLKSVAAYHAITTLKLIELHSAPLYRVSFLGFLPGFPYLSGLPAQLHTPRKDTPRPRIHAGSVGIGGKQTGIYPQDSPGGWNLVGKSPFQFFDVSKDSPSLLQVGDFVKFSPVNLAEFQQIAAAVEAGTYSLDKQAYD